MRSRTSRGNPAVGLQIVVVCALLAGSAYLGRLVYHNEFVHRPGGVAVGASQVPELVVGRSVSEGSRIELTPAGAATPTLFLVLSAECPYCAENMPQWVQILDSLTRHQVNGVELLALSTSGAKETADFLAAHGLSDISAVTIGKSELSVLGLRGVPGTLAVTPGSISVTPGSISLRTWAGVLSDADVDSIVGWALATQNLDN